MTAGLATTFAVLAVACGAGPRRVRVPGTPGAWASIDERVARRVVAADLPVRVPRPLMGWLGAATVGAVAFGVAASPVTVGLLTTVVVVPPAALAARGDRSGAMLARQLPGFVDGVSRQLRVGRSLPQAFDELRRAATHPLDGDLDAIVAHAARGRPVVDELHQWARSHSEVDLHLVVTALTVGQQTGGERAAALDGVARSLRDRHAVSGELEALTAQARASAVVVALAPPAFTLMLMVWGIAPAVSWRQPSFAITGGVGVMLDIGGLVWMRRLTRPRW